MIHPKIQESSTRCPNWAKTSLLWQDNSQVYFVGTSEGSWLGRQLFQANLDGRQKVKQITKEPGMHGVVVDKHLGSSWVQKDLDH